MQRWSRNIRKQVRSKRFQNKVVAADPRSILKDAVQDMAQNAFIGFIFRKNGSQNIKQAAFFQKTQQQRENATKS